ncbi:MAG: sodium ion-translocating decarboxylase subunit beta [Peptococcaceae bacterium]|jgi:oxaloacetate decarboxylase beta subunit|nr:sodium ion-translocating decarboxylase subunit beta [Peptococcaceae bacterium]
MDFLEALASLWMESGVYKIISNPGVSWQNLVMIVIACVLLYLAIVRQFEPLLLLGIAFGMLLANIPQSGMIHMELYAELPISFSRVLHEGGMLDILYLGVKLGIYPCLIFMGIGAMTDFGPLLSNPASMLLGAAAQLGIFCAFIIANILGFTPMECGSISIIGGADGPTAIYLATKLAPHLLPAIAIAAYSYMALIPLIQPPIMRALTSQKEREVKMTQLREVSKVEKILFPIAVTILCCLILPSVTPLIGMLMLGNLFRESGIVERLSETAQNALINIVTIFLSLTVGATAVGETFLQPDTLKIIFLGLFAFCFSTVGGVLFGKVLHLASGGKINPLIGSAGVSAVPMAARVSQVEGQRANPSNYLLMHAMGPNVAGVIGSAVAAGFLLSLLGK